MPCCSGPRHRPPGLLAVGCGPQIIILPGAAAGLAAPDDPGIIARWPARAAGLSWPRTAGGQPCRLAGSPADGLLRLAARMIRPGPATAYSQPGGSAPVASGEGCSRQRSGRGQAWHRVGQFRCAHRVYPDHRRQALPPVPAGCATNCAACAKTPG